MVRYGINPAFLILGGGIEEDIDWPLRRPPGSDYALHLALEKVRLPRACHGPRNKAGVGHLLHAGISEGFVGYPERRGIHFRSGHSDSGFDAGKEAAADALRQ